MSIIIAWGAKLIISLFLFAVFYKSNVMRLDAKISSITASLCIY